MVLVDTSVWVHHLRFSNPELVSLLNNAEVMIHPFVIGELACGNLKNRNEILTLLHSLPAVSQADDDEILFFVEKNKLFGKGVGLIDVHLLSSSKLENILLWTTDKKLEKVANKLNLAYITTSRKQI